jgi:internalin A
MEASSRIHFLDYIDRRAKMKVFATLALLILFLFSPCSSDALTLVSPPWDYNIANLVKHTDLVVLGKVTGMRLIPQEHSTSITISVESVIKGEKAVGDRLLRFTVSGNAGMKKHRGKRINWLIPGSLKFKLGERLLLFMGGSHGDYHILRPGGKIMVRDNRVYIPYTYKTNRFSDYHNEMRERKVRRSVELPLDLVVKVAKASIKDYDAIKEIEADVATAVSLTAEKGARPILSVELLKRLEETADQIFEKSADGDEWVGTRQLETIEGKSFEPPITVEFDNSVDIPDPNLRAEIEGELGRTSIAPITAADMESLTTLYADRADISDLTGLEAAINLTELRLDANNISDISALSGLANLTRLRLSHNPISDLSVLSRLTNLTRLMLSHNSLSDLSVLSGLTNLTHLGLRRNAISDISAVSGLTNLTHLWLHDNSISDISAVSGLTNLTLLWLGDNTISDISLVSGLTNLTELVLRKNSISDISPVSGLTNLTKLELGKNSLSNISALSGLINLTRLTLNYNSLADISAVSGLTNLTWLELQGNRISDLSAVSGLTKLTLLGLWDNTISDLSPLVSNTGLGRGDMVDVDENPLNAVSLNTHILTLQSRGVNVRINKPVNIPNRNLRAKIKAALGKAAGETITRTDMAMLTTLHASFAEISMLTGLEYATNLTHLYLEDNRISDLSALSRLTNLLVLYLDNNNISDLSALSGLTNLTELELQGNHISDVSELSRLTNLTLLWLNANNISDISSLSGLTNLTELYLAENNISDLSPLVSNAELGIGDHVDVRGNPLSAVSINTHIPTLLRRGVNVRFDNSVNIPDPNLRAAIEAELGKAAGDTITVADMESLTTLEADRADISDLTGLEAAINLTELRLDANNISDISALSGLANLTRLRLSHNPISEDVEIWLMWMKTP